MRPNHQGLARARWAAALLVGVLALTGACGPAGRDAAGQTRFGGQQVRWPRQARPSLPPPPLGAVRTRARTTLRGGGTLAAGLVLPVVGGSAARPTVLTPCGNPVSLADAAVTRIPSSSPADPVVVLDPGHGGSEDGTHAPNGTREAERTLQLALAVRDALRGTHVRVVLTRDRDTQATLGFRVALADALRANLAVSIHLNASPTTTRPYPGTEVFGSIADPHGRRAAGVLYQAERRYLQRLSTEVGGHWAANRDAGALYRLGRNGDYYYLLRQSHVTWVISESLYLSNAGEAALLAQPQVRAGLGSAIAAGIISYLSTTDPGSGWRTPVSRPPAPAASASPTPASCVDPN